MGYHRLLVEQPGGEPLTSVLVASPERCVVPRDLGIERCFGIGAQAYSLRSERDLGSGDLADLTAFAEVSGREGADFLALNPLHALFFSTPANRSPYAPSHRRFLNWLLIAPDKVPELEGDPELEAARAEARGDDPHLIDYPATAARRRRLLEAGFARFKEQHLGSRPTPRGAAFLTFRKADGQGLERHCLFEAMHEQVLAEGKAFAWWEWPEGWRDPQSAEARAFAERHKDRVDFFAWLQWLADSQLGEAQDRAKAAGMRIGLYRDLAVGVDPAGSLTWSFPEVAVRGATVGAPPDIYNPRGQNWGIAPLAPEALARAGFGPWIGDIRGNMRHAGALRIDHAMGLRRLYWIPQGAEPGEGAYVRYPFATMAAILALESHRSQCLVLGEDLGTVPPGFRPAMNRAGILSCRVLYFERTGSGGYTAPAAYPEAAVASVSTHDLATLKGWLEAHDLGWRERLDLFVEEGQAEAARADRELDAMRLIRTLRRAGLLAPRSEPDAETLALARPSLARPHALGPRPGPARGPRALARAGEPAGHHRRASELAPAHHADAGRSSHLTLRQGPPGGPQGGATPWLRLQTPPTASSSAPASGSRDAERLVPYLDRLGISHLYLAPPFTARKGSTHGYDVADANELDPTLGGMPAFEKMAAALREHGMGLIIDIVPNHMGVGPDNPWWWDVLKHGRESAFAGFFDIDFDRDPDGKLVLPVLGSPLDEILEKGELKLAQDEARGETVLAYYDTPFPLAPGSEKAGDIRRVLERQAYRLDSSGATARSAITAASSTSASSAACGSRSPRCSRPCTRSSSIWSSVASCRASGSTMSTGSATPKAISSACRSG